MSQPDVKPAPVKPSTAPSIAPNPSTPPSEQPYPAPKACGV